MRKWAVLASAVLALLPVAADGPVLAVSLRVVREGTSAAPWALVTAAAGPALLLGLLLPLGARAVRRWGARRGQLLGLGVLATGAVVAASAGSGRVLVTGRLLEGAAGALLVPATLGGLVAAFPPEDRRRALAIWGGFTGLLALVAPLGVAALVEATSWRAAFAVAVPPAAMAAALVATATPALGEAEPPARLRVDPAALVAGGLALGLLVHLQEVERLRPTSLAACLLPGALTVVLLVPRAVRVARRAGELRLRRRGLCVVAAAALGCGLLSGHPPVLVVVGLLTVLAAGAAMAGLQPWGGGAQVARGLGIVLLGGPVVAEPSRLPAVGLAGAAVALLSAVALAARLRVGTPH